jgi:hypothetical protein
MTGLTVCGKCHKTVGFYRGYGLRVPLPHDCDTVRRDRRALGLFLVAVLALLLFVCVALMCVCGWQDRRISALEQRPTITVQRLSVTGGPQAAQGIAGLLRAAGLPKLAEAPGVGR